MLSKATSQLIPAGTNQPGANWHQLCHDPATDFSFQGHMYFGAIDAGGSGIVFVMNEDCALSTTAGPGMSDTNMFGASIGIEFDTAPSSLLGDTNNVAIHQDGGIDQGAATNHLLNRGGSYM